MIGRSLIAGEDRVEVVGQEDGMSPDTEAGMCQPGGYAEQREEAQKTSKSLMITRNSFIPQPSKHTRMTLKKKKTSYKY